MKSIKLLMLIGFLGSVLQIAYAIPVSDGFDYPVGTTGYVTQANDGDGYYNAQDFGVSNHLGEDWNGEGGGNTDYGDPVYSSANGTVVYCGNGGSGWGTVVIIRHQHSSGTLLETLYAHLSAVYVSNGQNVNRRSTIGAIGDAGGVYYAHLHFELRYSNCASWGSPGPGYSSNSTGWTDPSNYINNNRPISNPTGCTWYVTPTGGTQSVLPSNYIFWIGATYTISGSVANLPNGYHYAVCIYNSSGTYLTYPISDQANSTFSFSFGGMSGYNATGFRFKLVPQFLPDQPIPNTESNPWNTGPYPTLNLSGPSNSSYTQGSSFGLSWSVSGGITGLTYGGWSSGAQLRFQWYQGSTALEVISPNVNLTDWSSTITANHNPGTNYRIGVSNIGAGSSLPDGIPSAFSNYFQISAPTYEINVNSSPSGASIYVDGSYSGYGTPHSFSLTQGSSATFTVQQSGYTWTPPSFPVTNISSNQSVNFVGTLLTYTVYITSSPTDSDIYVNGIDSGYNSPHTFTLNYGASATYTMQKTGYTWSPTQFTVTNIQSNQSQYFTGTLSVPGAAILSTPANGASGLSYTSQTLTWAAGTGNAPTGYKVYFGTANPPTSLVSTQTGLSYPTGALSPSSTYYWKVVAYNGTGDAPSSSIWSFTTAAVSSFSVNITSSPSDAAIFVEGSSSGFNTPHTFSLTQGSSATYSVQLAGYTWVPTYFTVSNIQANTSQNFVGTLSVPGAAVLSSPSNSATGLSYASQTLVWTAGSGNPPTGYKVYLGTANPPTSLVSTQTELTYTTTLNPSTTYYWKVVAFNGTGEAPSSSIWSFSTAAQTVLPNLTAFQINNGAESTTSVNVVLNITASEATHYMASENPEFSGASWLTYSASPSFTLSASPGLKTVYLKVKNANAESGTLSDQISLTSAQPLWTPITGNQYSAIGFFNVHIDGVLFTGDNGQNLLGAFNAAEECLGVGYWQSNLFYMDILNNNNGSTVYFKIYDSTNDEILSCNETLVFTDNEVYGTPESPVSLNVVTSVSLTYNLVTGWNWISIPIQFSNPSPANVFASLGSSIQTVKTQTQSAIRATNGTWYGTLTTITGLSSYLVQMNSSATLTLSGYPIAPETQIGLVTNWNWPAYLPTTSGITVPTAFSSLIPNVYIVKTQNQSKMYSTSTSQWIGSLSSVNPGQGIKVQMTAVDNLIYQSSKLSELAQSSYLESNGYPDNMIIHAQLFDNSMHPINLGEYEVCFVDNSNIVHGIGEEVSVNGSSFVYFTMGGSSDDAYLIPCIRNTATGQKYNAVPIAFVPDEIVGSYDVPSQIFFNTLTQVGVDEQVYSYPQVKVIPNPILNQGKICLSNFSRGSDNITIDIFDIRGRIVKHYQSVDQPEIEIPSEIPSGIYFVRVKSQSLKYTAKFTKIK